MLLILSTALLALYVKRAFVIILFVIISHVALGAIIQHFSITADISGTILSFLASLVIGLSLYAWKWWYMSKRTEYIGLKRFRTTIIALIAIFVSFNAFIIYLGIKKGQEYVAQSRELIAGK